MVNQCSVLCDNAMQFCIVSFLQIDLDFIGSGISETFYREDFRHSGLFIKLTLGRVVYGRVLYLGPS